MSFVDLDDLEYEKPPVPFAKRIEGTPEMIEQSDEDDMLFEEFKPDEPPTSFFRWSIEEAPPPQLVGTSDADTPKFGMATKAEPIPKKRKTVFSRIQFRPTPIRPASSSSSSSSVSSLSSGGNERGAFFLEATREEQFDKPDEEILSISSYAEAPADAFVVFYRQVPCHSLLKSAKLNWIVLCPTTECRRQYFQSDGAIASGRLSGATVGFGIQWVSFAIGGHSVKEIGEAEKVEDFSSLADVVNQFTKDPNSDQVQKGCTHQLCRLDE